MTRAPHDPRARRPHGPGDAWVEGAQGRFWGRFGAAGLLLAHPDAGVLLQLRAEWSHLGGTWGIPGGARHDEHETAVAGALREADEEAGVPQHLVRVLGEAVWDLGYWSYTTVYGRALEHFEPVIGDAESVSLRWVPFAEVERLPLHPGLAAAWSSGRDALARLDPELAAAIRG
ncbi:NUDIX domain-containing protein [Protaetiibacter mangrovi]|uniref:NUDIX hydrolase n=1 Tax=Protaetiibacter mangrovi TaxID=2970926 RepID=A0ABT1ZB96_9MICO|nr:NUDIX hydrolase [Protaetiibacter mangrovi]MCS0497977.1 NUDIX hydrolase [Protaetiibacter mangrovi]TPX05223.1 NUDIX domain-containing protein [Schumannella luteola]